MTKERIVLIQKDKLKGNEASNYRPITCLPLIWKLLTGIIIDEIYGFLEDERILMEEQTGYRRKSMGTGDQSYIDASSGSKMFEEELSDGMDRLSKSL